MHNIQYLHPLIINIKYNNFMFLVILVSPLVFLACFLLPFVGTIFSREQSSKWIAFWLLQIVASWTLIPFLGLFFECQVQMVFKILIALGLIFALSPSLVNTISSQIQSVVGIAEKQKQNAEEQVSKVAKQYGLIE